jgi:hypothetical protein
MAAIIVSQSAPSRLRTGGATAPRIIEASSSESSVGSISRISVAA